MSALVLEKDPNNKLGGTVLLSQGAGWPRPTGVFLPDASVLGDRHLTIILWFHGYRVPDVPYLFYTEATNLLQAVLASKRRVVLVAPHLGHYKSKASTDYNASALDGGKGVGAYLDLVLAAIADWSLTQLIDLDPKPPAPKYQVAELYLAGHSGGGDGIASAVSSLGAYKETLRECWGFDCVYGSGAVWYQWARARGGMPLYFYFGQGTKPLWNGDVLGLWRPAYGTPNKPLPVGARLLNLHLAPALLGTEMDSVAFQFSEDIKRKRAANRYEEVRQQVDPLLDDTGQYWSKIIELGLFDHYPVVSELLGPRIRQSIL